MRSGHTSKNLLFSIVATLVLIGFSGNVISQGLPGRPVVAPPATPKPSAPTTRNRHATAKTRAPRKTESNTGNESETAPTTPALAPLPVPGIEEKNQGIEAYNQKNYDRAIEKLTAAGSVRPADTEIFYTLGDCYTEKKEWAHAIEAYEHARKVNETQATDVNYFNLGVAYEETKNYTYALTAYKSANAKKPNDFDTLTHLGDVSTKLSQWQYAVSYYEQAAKVDPDIKDPDVFFNWGIAYVNTSLNYEAAVPKFKKAIELNIDDVAEAYFQLGKACRYTQRFQEAIDAFQKQLAKRNDDQNAFWAYNYLGEISFALGDKPGAVDAYRNAVRIDRQSDRCWDYLGTAYTNLNNYDEAVAAHRQAVALAPSNPFYHLNLGKAYFWSGKYTDALEPLNKAIELKPNMTEAFFYRGVTYRSMDQFSQAVEALNRSLELGFEKKDLEASARYNLAISYSRLGNSSAARQQCDLLRNSGWDATHQDSFGVCRP